MSRPGRTGMTSSRILTPRMVWKFSSRPRRSYSVSFDHSTSFTTTSMRLRSRMAVTPKRSLMLRMPSPRTSRWWRSRSAGGAEDHPRGAVVALDGVVGDEAVAAHHEIERASRSCRWRSGRRGGAPRRRRRRGRRGGARAGPGGRRAARGAALMVTLERSLERRQRGLRLLGALEELGDGHDPDPRALVLLGRPGPA